MGSIFIIDLTVVVFPHPASPMRPTFSPLATLKFTPLRTLVTPS